AGHRAAIHVLMATDVEYLWDLLAPSERNRKHCFLMENCAYGRQALAMLRMAHDGLFGDISNGHGGYLHDLRELLFSETYYYQQWRRKWHTKFNRAFYTMHGLAPIDRKSVV